MSEALWEPQSEVISWPREQLLKLNVTWSYNIPLSENMLHSDLQQQFTGDVCSGALQ